MMGTPHNIGSNGSDQRPDYSTPSYSTRLGNSLFHSLGWTGLETRTPWAYLSLTRSKGD